MENRIGGRHAFASLVREGRSRAYQVALRLCRNPEEAEDLMQETMCRVLTNWPRFDQSRPWEPWVFTIMRNAFLDNQRNCQRRKESPLDDGADNLDFDHEPSILDSLIRQENVLVVREAFAGLKAQHQEVLMLSDVDGLAYQEIAAWTGIPLGTVRSRISRGREYLRRKVRELDQELAP